MIEVKNEVGEILLSGVVGDGWDENPITQKEVGKALKSFGNSPVTIRINSPGGSADEGIGIYNTILSHGGEVTTINDSLAASAASIIFLAGSKRLMADGSRLMIHRALGFAFGNQDELRKYLAALESYDRSLVDIYSKYMSESKDQIEALLSAETWYEADAAIDAGLATGRVENGNKKRKPSNQMDAAKANLQRLAMAKYSQHLTRGK